MEPIPMILHCPWCGSRHLDEGAFATKPHHTHACQSCGMVWRPAVVPTVGVQFLPGFKNEPRNPQGYPDCGFTPTIGGKQTCDCDPYGACVWRDTSKVVV